MCVLKINWKTKNKNKIRLHNKLKIFYYFKMITWDIGIGTRMKWWTLLYRFPHSIKVKITHKNRDGVERIIVEWVHLSFLIIIRFFRLI